MSETHSSNPFRLLKHKNFSPFFFTQFLGAFNDNVFKNALAIMITYHGSEWTNLNPALLVTLCAGLFILPFFPLSATAGELAEKSEKSALIRQIKFAEIMIALIVILGFSLHNIFILIGALFLLGVQAAFFGPVKYSIIPQHLAPKDIVAGNGLVEMGTFIAILLGTILGGLLISNEKMGVIYVSSTVLFLALLGFLLSLFIPNASATEPELKVNWNVFTATCNSLKLINLNRHVYVALIGISWFWFYGALFLSQFSLFCKFLGGNEFVVTVFLTMFSIGAGIGSVFCEKLSKGKIELALVTIGGIGLTIFALDVFLASPSQTSSQLVGFREFFTKFQNLRISVDLLLMGISSGFFTVPLYADLQMSVPENYRSRIIGANNILNTIFMVASTGMALFVLKLNLSISTLFLFTPVLTLLVLIYLHFSLKDLPKSFLDYFKKQN